MNVVKKHFSGVLFNTIFVEEIGKNNFQWCGSVFYSLQITFEIFNFNAFLKKLLECKRYCSVLTKSNKCMSLHWW